MNPEGHVFFPPEDVLSPRSLVVFRRLLRVCAQLPRRPWGYLPTCRPPARRVFLRDGAATGLGFSAGAGLVGPGSLVLRRR
jgi:hypothetical protein